MAALQLFLYIFIFNYSVLFRLYFDITDDDEWWRIVFVGWLTYKQPAVVFPEGNIIRYPHHCDFLKHRDGNRFRIAKTAIRNVTITRRQNLYNNLRFRRTKSFPHIFLLTSATLKQRIHNFPKFLGYGCLTFPALFRLVLFVILC